MPCRTSALIGDDIVSLNTISIRFVTFRQRAYFKNVHILVPESWSNSDAYSNVDWQRYDQSDVIVDLPSDNGDNRPYTNKPTPCGEPGLFIHLTPDYILSQRIAGRFGDYDKVVHLHFSSSKRRVKSSVLCMTSETEKRFISNLTYIYFLFVFMHG